MVVRSRAGRPQTRDLIRDVSREKFSLAASADARHFWMKRTNAHRETGPGRSDREPDIEAFIDWFVDWRPPAWSTPRVGDRQPRKRCGAGFGEERRLRQGQHGRLVVEESPEKAGRVTARSRFDVAARVGDLDADP
jgi:hypothetical protein